MSSAVSCERTHCSVGPRLAQIDATVVPQEPPPRTTTFGSRCAGAMAIRVLPTGEPRGRFDRCQRVLAAETPRRHARVGDPARQITRLANSEGAYAAFSFRSCNDQGPFMAGQHRAVR